MKLLHQDTHAHRNTHTYTHTQRYTIIVGNEHQCHSFINEANRRWVSLSVVNLYNHQKPFVCLIDVIINIGDEDICTLTAST